MPLNELELIYKYCHALQIETLGDLKDFINEKHCTNNAELKSELVQAYIELFEEDTKTSKTPVKTNATSGVQYNFDKQIQAKGTTYTLIVRGIRTNWYFVHNLNGYVVYYKTNAIKLIKTEEEARKLCVEAFRLFD